MNNPSPQSSKRHTTITVVVLLALGIAGWFTRASWLPTAEKAVAWLQNRGAAESNGGHGHGHGHGHAHGPHGGHMAPAAATGSEDTLKLTSAAWKNLGLETGEVKTSDFSREITFPAAIVERPGRSRIQITAPLTGIVTKIFPLEREIVDPETPLFELRLTHEDIVKAQGDFLKALKEKDIILKELQRLQKIGSDIIPGKRILAKEFEGDRAEATLSAMRQSLLLHDLTESQIEEIEQTRLAIQSITITTPPHEKSPNAPETTHVFHVKSIDVSIGQSVQHGDMLGELSDHGLLYVEGQAFEDDAQKLIAASQSGKQVKVFPASATASEPIWLDVQSIADEVDMKSRALKFYLLLPNQLLNPQTTTPNSEKRFVSWKYRPGYRMEVHVPNGPAMKNRIVLPAEAVAIDGPNAFVFEQNGDNFDRIDVQVLYQDQHTVVLENDAELIGSFIATKGAWQLHLALKNAAGGGIDPHHGHSH